MDSFGITLSLIRSSLWGEALPEVELSEGWWEEVYEISRAQGVHTLIPDAFRPGFAPQKSLLGSWVLELERSEAAFGRINSVLEELKTSFKSSGISFVVLKGTSLARMYPRPEHRASGDIDLYFPAVEGWNAALKLVQRNADITWDSDGDYHYYLRGVVIEHHRKWHHLSSPSTSNLAAAAEGPMLRPEDDLLMLSSHILRHSLVGGAGLRQLTDLAVATRFYDGKYDKAQFRKRMEELKLSKWSALLSSVLKECFGLSEADLPVPSDPSRREEYLNLVKADGDLGKEGPIDFRLWLSRIKLFAAVAPRELLSRYLSLSFGRVGRLLKSERK